MGAIESQITSLTIVYSTVYSDPDQRKHQSSASLAFVRGIHRGPVNSPHKWSVTRKMIHLMTSSCRTASTQFNSIYICRVRSRAKERIQILFCSVDVYVDKAMLPPRSRSHGLVTTFQHMKKLDELTAKMCSHVSPLYTQYSYRPMTVF